MKLKLNLQDLAVDSFDTAALVNPRGTVFGEQCTCWTRCAQQTCAGYATCDASCNGTCVNSCANTCAYTCDDASCAGTCGNTCNTCDYSCYDTGCGYGYTCGNCTAWQTNCNEICH